MKKLLAALLLLPSLAWATYIPVNGSTVSINNIVNPLPTGTNNIGTVTGSTMSLQSAGVAITATSGALDMNIKSGSIANTGFNVNNTVTVNPHAVTNLNSVVISSFAATSSPMANIVMIGSNPVTTSGKVGEQLVSVEIAGSSNTVIASTFSVIGIDGTSRHVGYDAQASSVPVNVLNTVTITGSISNSGFNVNNTPAVTQSGAWTISNLNNVVISSFAATSTPMENLVLVGSSPVTTSSKVGEQLVSVEITGSSNTVIVSTEQVITISGTSNHLGWDAQASSMPVASAGPAIGATVAGAPLYQGAVASSSTLPALQTNGKGQYVTSDTAGRLLTVSGVPTWMIKFASATITTTAPFTLISSGGANNFNDLCGCMGTNTSATNTFAIFNSTGALNTGNIGTDFVLGLPANDVPIGFGPINCAAPIPQRASNTNWIVAMNNAVTDTRITCWYYTIAR